MSRNNGIGLQGSSDNNVLEKNTVEYNRNGIHTWQSSGNQIIGNIAKKWNRYCRIGIF